VTAPGSFWCEQAWLPEGPAASVLVSCDAAGVITEVAAGRASPPPGAVRLRGLVTPGFANAHSHAFHRALRGRSHGQRGSFWTWRRQMYDLAGRLDPDSYRRLARAVYAEMTLAGFTAVGEFHYLHHPPGAGSYRPASAMTDALRSAAGDAGIRLTVIDTCYLTGGIGQPLSGEQRRFSDGSAERWAERVAAALAAGGDTAAGGTAAGIHSVRAVPPDAIAAVAGFAADHRLPLHVHLSEQQAENDACRASYGCTPTQLLERHGALGERTTVVHATHLEPADIATLGRCRGSGCFCPTTERDLADGIGPARQLADAGVRLCLGSDQHAVIDPLAELRALEMDERLASGERGRFTVAELLAAATTQGHVALGSTDAGRIVPGARCDLVAISTGTVRTAGAAVEQLPLVASAADVRDVVVGGRAVVEDGRHLLVADPAADLAAAIDAVAG
jgi:formiminoglutamate deiminase